MSVHYFATDGNYGSASDIVIVHTDNWTTQDWDAVIDSSDSERAEIASQIAESKRDTEIRLLGL